MENCLKPVLKEIWKQRRSAGMRLNEENTGAHIHCDATNYLTEEDMNIMAHLAYSPDRCTVCLLAK